MVGALSFSQPYNLLQKIHCPILAIFCLPIPPLFIHKITITIPTNTPFLYTSAIFHLPIFAYSHLYNLHQKQFPYHSHLANLSCVKGPMSKGFLWGLTLYCFNWHCFNFSLFPQSIDRDNRAQQSLILVASDEQDRNQYRKKFIPLSLLPSNYCH